MGTVSILLSSKEENSAQKTLPQKVSSRQPWRGGADEHVAKS